MHSGATGARGGAQEAAAGAGAPEAAAGAAAGEAGFFAGGWACDASPAALLLATAMAAACCEGSGRARKANWSRPRAETAEDDDDDDDDDCCW